MSQRMRIVVGIIILVAIIGVVLGVDALQRARQANGPVAAGEPTLAPGAIPIELDGTRIAGFGPADLEELELVSFVDDEEGKTQEGWLLRDVLLLHLDPEQLDAQTQIVVSSSSRDRSAQVTWAETEDRDNMVMLDLSGRGTLKLVSRIPGLDIRDQWVQDVDLIAITSP